METSKAVPVLKRMIGIMLTLLKSAILNRRLLFIREGVPLKWEAGILKECMQCD